MGVQLHGELDIITDSVSAAQSLRAHMATPTPETFYPSVLSTRKGKLMDS